MSRSQNTSQNSSKNEQMSSLTNIALRTTANLARRIRDSKPESEVVNSVVKTACSVQEYIPVKNIEDGFVITTDGRYLILLEIDSVNFEQMTDERKLNMMNSLAKLFRKGFKTASLHILSDKFSPDSYIESMVKEIEKDKNPKRREVLQSYITYLYQLSKNSSIVHRYFLVAEYSGDEEGHRTTDKDEILEQLAITRINIMSTLSLDGRTFVFHADDDEMNPDEISKNRNLLTAQILYYFFNRKSILSTSFLERRTRAAKDYKTYRAETGVNKNATLVDAISPKGLRFDMKSSVFQDGQYYTYLGIKSGGYPTNMPITWPIYLVQGKDGIDLTLRFTAMPREATMKALSAIGRLRKSSAKSKMYKGRQEEAEMEQAKYLNSEVYLSAMNNSDDMYNLDTIITIRATTKKELTLRKNGFLKDYNSWFSFEDSYLCAEDYYRATLPLLCKSSVLSRLHKQIISTHIGNAFPFISNKINKPSGYLLGVSGTQPIIVDNFDKSYASGNMFVLGMPGSGKTFSECVISGRYSMNGTRIHVICPAKGGEYIGLAELYGGEFINLAPGQQCINIMDIRAEANPDRTDSSGNVATAEFSYLAKKVKMLCAWFSLNMGKESLTRVQRSKLETLLAGLYERKGITNDNRSLFSNGKIKEMPILQDWYDAMLKDSDLADIAYVLEYYVTNKDGIKGNGSNLNGQTKVDLSNKITIYDVSFDEGSSIPEEYGPAYMYLAFQTAYDRVKENLKTRDMIVIDEAWMMLKNADSGKQIADAIKLIRSYHGCCIIATQELEDFLHCEGDYGRTVLNLCSIKMLMKASERAVLYLSKQYELPKEETQAMMEFGRGDALLMAGNNRMIIHVTPTDDELKAFNTDREKT